ncbi:MAG TPA: AMP-binding protein [Propionibacterium sp.]|nr:AMP-binding protein [Propionibacterium sp.]
MRIVHGPGGRSAAAVAELYDWLAARLSPTRPSAAPREVLLAAPSVADFDEGRRGLTGPLDEVDVVIRTSGSTDGRGHLVGLSLDALVASARATLVRIGGPGQWVTSLPVHGVAGLQVVVRSVLAGHRPVVYAPGKGFDPGLFAGAVAGLDRGARRYLSLVPTQLHRAVEVAPDELAAFDAILVGGAALPPDLARRAADAGARIISTYGSTETSGGCVYDGVPLDGVDVRVVDGLVQVAGPHLATRYLDTETQPFVHEAGCRWLTTHDLGVLGPDGHLTLRGRADDVIISGGVNVNPHDVEAALAALRGEWVVVGVPDAQWGQRLVAVTTGDADLGAVRRATAHLAPAARPKDVVHVAALPLRPTGKVDRRGVRAQVTTQALP